MPLFRSTSCLAPLGGCAFLALWVVSCSAFCLGPFVCVSVVCPSLLACLPLLCTCLLCGLCVPPLCTWALCCAACGICGRLPPSPLGCFRVASWPSNFSFTGPSLWVSGCFLRPPSCLALLLGVLWCFASSLHFAPRQQRPLALCGVFDYPLHHGAYVVVGLCAPSLRYSSS